jgi:hypothetical protein
MPEIRLTQGKVTFVDDADFEYLSQWKWCYTHGYGVRRKRDSEPGDKQRIYMHRVIAGSREDELVDHINRNRLDNRRANLRLMPLNDQSHSLLNRFMDKKNKTGVRGVVRLKAGKRKPERFVAYLSVKNKTKYLGTFSTLSEAEDARVAASLESHGVHYYN